MLKYSSLKVHFLVLSSTCCPVYVVMNGLAMSFSPYVPHLKKLTQIISGTMEQAKV